MDSLNGNVGVVAYQVKLIKKRAALAWNDSVGNPLCLFNAPRLNYVRAVFFLCEPLYFKLLHSMRDFEIFSSDRGMVYVGLQSNQQSGPRPQVLSILEIDSR